MSSLSTIIGEVNEVMCIVESQYDPETGELLPLTPELEEKLNTGLQKLTKKIDSIGYAMVMSDKELEGYKAIKAMADAKIKSKQSSTKRFKAYLAKIVRAYGSQNDKGVYQLKGNLVTAKDNSGYEFEIDEAFLKDSAQPEHQDVVVRIPRKKYESRVAFKKAIDEVAESISFELNKERLKNEYEKQFNELNGIKENIDADSLMLSLPKDKIKYPQMAGIRKLWVDKTTFLGLKKLGVEDGADKK
jgi:hypothetical protein